MTMVLNGRFDPEIFIGILNQYKVPLTQSILSTEFPQVSVVYLVPAAIGVLTQYPGNLSLPHLKVIVVVISITGQLSDSCHDR